MVILKTIVGNLSANVNEITFTDAIINSNSIIEVYYNSNDVYTVETWQRENTIGIVTSDHDFPVSVKVLINNVVAFEPYDDSQVLSQLSDLDGRVTDAEDAISGLATRVGDAEDDIDALETAMTGKQDVLTAGENITIEDNVISASGGGVINIYPSDSTPVIVGKYGDRDIYRVRVYLPTVYTNSNSFTVNVAIDKLINIQGYAKDSAGNYRFMSMGSIIQTAQNWNCSVLLYGNYQGHISGDVWVGNQFNNGSVEMWIDYVPVVE